jgi:hypothetical protein
LNSKEAGTTGNTRITGISLVVKYAEPFFYKCLFLFISVFSVVPVVLFAQPQTGVY